MTIRILTCILTLLIVGSQSHGQEIVVADFESDSYGEWKVEGDAFGTGPTAGHKLQVTGYRGGRIVN